MRKRTVYERLRVCNMKQQRNLITIQLFRFFHPSTAFENSLHSNTVESHGRINSKTNGSPKNEQTNHPITPEDDPSPSANMKPPSFRTRNQPSTTLLPMTSRFVSTPQQNVPITRSRQYRLSVATDSNALAPSNCVHEEAHRFVTHFLRPTTVRYYPIRTGHYRPPITTDSNAPHRVIVSTKRLTDLRPTSYVPQPYGLIP